MAEGQFDIVFTGELVSDSDPESVRDRLAELFKITPEKAAALLGQRRVVIKRGLNGMAAAKYLHAIRQAGAIAQAVDTASAEAARPPAEARTQASPPAPAPEAPVSLTLAEVGVTLVEPEQVEEPSIDTSGLSIAEPGARLTELGDIEEPAIDLSGLTLAPEGSLLSDPDPDKR
jgi:hypothetical protein